MADKVPPHRVGSALVDIMLGTAIASSGSGYGFTYDQQTEPSSPSTGQTWIERSAGGAILGHWEWSGSLWLALESVTYSAGQAQTGATSYAILSIDIPKALVVELRISLGTVVNNPSTPFNSTNYREWWISRGSFSTSAGMMTFRPMITGSGTTYSTNPNYYNPTACFFYTGTTSVGTPGSMCNPSCSLTYRRVR